MSAVEAEVTPICNAEAILSRLKVKIFADGADQAALLELNARSYVRGLTTNPTLMRRAGIRDYRAFAREVLREIKCKPVCFEVLADDFQGMERQALEIASWGDNVYVKVPVTDTRRQSSRDLIARLVEQKVQVNVTAVTTLEQVRHVMSALDPAVPSYVSIFAGRIADTGRDPLPIMAEAVDLLRSNVRCELIWASSRELLNIFQADSAGCAVITVGSAILEKLTFIGYDLSRFSLDTVRMFHADAVDAGLYL